jgi:hypothetical protein
MYTELPTVLKVPKPTWATKDSDIPRDAVKQLGDAEMRNPATKTPNR